LAAGVGREPNSKPIGDNEDPARVAATSKKEGGGRWVFRPRKKSLPRNGKPPAAKTQLGWWKWFKNGGGPKEDVITTETGIKAWERATKVSRQPVGKKARFHAKSNGRNRKRPGCVKRGKQTQE